MRPIYTEDQWRAQQAWARANRRAERILLFATGLVAGAAAVGAFLVILNAWSAL